MAKLATVLLLVFSATGCFKTVAMASHKDKLYVYKQDKMYMCETDQAGNMSCSPTTGAP